MAGSFLGICAHFTIPLPGRPSRPWIHGGRPRVARGKPGPGRGVGARSFRSLSWRFPPQAGLGFHRPGDYEDDPAVITSELVTNAVQHVSGDVTETIGVTLARAWNLPASG